MGPNIAGTTVNIYSNNTTYNRRAVAVHSQIRISNIFKAQR
jgi:hypothetical protein